VKGETQALKMLNINSMILYQSQTKTLKFILTKIAIHWTVLKWWIILECSIVQKDQATTQVVIFKVQR
jgi:hypothetical protein